MESSLLNFATTSNIKYEVKENILYIQDISTYFIKIIMEKESILKSLILLLLRNDKLHINMFNFIIKNLPLEIKKAIPVLLVKSGNFVWLNSNIKSFIKTNLKQYIK